MPRLTLNLALTTTSPLDLLWVLLPYAPSDYQQAIKDALDLAAGIDNWDSNNANDYVIWVVSDSDSDFSVKGVTKTGNILRWNIDGTVVVDNEPSGTYSLSADSVVILGSSDLNSTLEVVDLSSNALTYVDSLGKVDSLLYVNLQDNNISTLNLELLLSNLVLTGTENGYLNISQNSLLTNSGLNSVENLINKDWFIIYDDTPQDVVNLVDTYTSNLQGVSSSLSNSPREALEDFLSKPYSDGQGSYTSLNTFRGVFEGNNAFLWLALSDSLPGVVVPILGNSGQNFTLAGDSFSGGSYQLDGPGGGLTGDGASWLETSSLPNTGNLSYGFWLTDITNYSEFYCGTRGTNNSTVRARVPSSDMSMTVGEPGFSGGTLLNDIESNFYSASLSGGQATVASENTSITNSVSIEPNPTWQPFSVFAESNGINPTTANLPFCYLANRALTSAERTVLYNALFDLEAKRHIGFSKFYSAHPITQSWYLRACQNSRDAGGIGIGAITIWQFDAAESYVQELVSSGILDIVRFNSCELSLLGEDIYAALTPIFQLPSSGDISIVSATENDWNSFAGLWLEDDAFTIGSSTSYLTSSDFRAAVLRHERFETQGTYGAIDYFYASNGFRLRQYASSGDGRTYFPDSTLQNHPAPDFFYLTNLYSGLYEVSNDGVVEYSDSKTVGPVVDESLSIAFITSGVETLHHHKHFALGSGLPHERIPAYQAAIETKETARHTAWLTKVKEEFWWAQLPNLPSPERQRVLNAATLEGWDGTQETLLDYVAWVISDADSSFDVSNATGATDIRWDVDGTIVQGSLPSGVAVSQDSSIIFSASDLTSLTDLRVQNNNITDISALENLTSLTQLWVHSNNLNTAQIDAAIQQRIDSNVNNGDLKLENNAPPTDLTGITTLQSRGWTVTYDAP